MNITSKTYEATKKNSYKTKVMKNLPWRLGLTQKKEKSIKESIITAGNFITGSWGYISVDLEETQLKLQVNRIES